LNVPAFAVENVGFVRTGVPAGGGPGATAGYALYGGNGTSNVSVKGCVFLGDSTAITNNGNLGVAFALSNGNNLVENSKFYAFSTALNMSGQAATTLATGNIIRNNTFKTNSVSINVSNQSGILIDKNSITDVSGTTANVYAVTANKIVSSTISNNMIQGTLSAGGMTLTDFDGAVGSATKVFNNVVNGTVRSATPRAFSFTGTFNAGQNNARDVVEVYYNSANIGFKTAAANANVSGLIHLAGGTNATPAWDGITVKNNNVAAYNAGANVNSNSRGMFIASDSTAFALISNNNNFFLNGVDTVIQVSTNGPTTTAATYTLSSWIASSGKDANSKNVDPFFGGTTLKPRNAAINDLGTPIAGITTDITGATRNSTTPDMGAYEFSGGAYYLTAVEDLNDTCSLMPRTVHATVAGGPGSGSPTVTLLYTASGSVNVGPYNTVTMTSAGNGNFTGTIPAGSSNTSVFYKVYVAGANGVEDSSSIFTYKDD
jgi:hypothetical protein